MGSSFFHYLTDPVLRAPTVGCMLMCLAASLVGVVAFIRKRSLLGEALSHATYPGVVLSVLLASWLFPCSEEAMALVILVGAFLSALCGLFAIDLLERFLKVKSDAALCFVLSIFFGVGVLIASRIQTIHPLWYKQIQLFLYGQAATLTDVHILIYGGLAALSLLFIFVLFRPIEMLNFDREFASSIGVKVKLVDTCIFFLLVLAVVIGIRSVGVVLMSGMLIAPAIAARQWTNRLSRVFIIAGCFGVISGFLGNYLSIEVPVWFSRGVPWKFSLPTGPMILLSASFFCLVSLLLAPTRGLFSRYLRIKRFKQRCRLENALKAFLRKGEGSLVTLSLFASWMNLSKTAAHLLLFRLLFEGWVEKYSQNSYRLTSDGKARALKIVRLHRLWEVYLVYLGQGVEKVHRNAEEMEHIITPELEKELTELLQDPKQDPHLQPIPAKNLL